MATINEIVLFAHMLFLVLTSSPSAKPAGQEIKEQRDYYAVVFLNRGNVANGTQSNVGLYRRSVGDTGWTNIYRRNLLSFSMGCWKSTSTMRLYLGAGNGLHRSTDGGRSWRVLTGWQIQENLSLALDPVDSAVLYIATPFGVFKSTDDGRRWEKKMKGMKKWFVKNVIIDLKNRRTLYAGGEDDLYGTTDGGERWSPLNVGAAGIQAVVQHPAFPDHLFVGTEDDGVRVSFNRGKTWADGKGLPKTAFYAITVSSDRKTIYAGGYRTGIWKSDDGGLTWQPLWQSPEIEAIFTIFVHPENSRHIMVGTSGQGIYESLDGGATWRTAGLQGCHIKQIELYP